MFHTFPRFDPATNHSDSVAVVEHLRAGGVETVAAARFLSGLSCRFTAAAVGNIVREQDVGDKRQSETVTVVYRRRRDGHSV